MNRVLFSSHSPHWATPSAVYDELNEEFGFDFDPCPLNAPDVELTEWHGKRVFCNPPYNREITKFLGHAPEADIAVFLLPSRTDTKWFHDMVLPNAKEIRFVKGRLKFGEAENSAPFPSVIVIFKKS